MDARTFLQRFQNIFEDKRSKAEKTYYNNTVFTAFITAEINSILSEGNHKKQNEYFRIDAIRWSGRADNMTDTPGVRLKKHLWDLEVAVEHENDPLDWMDEVVKLSHIACPLRVVIGYMPWDKRNEDQRYLDHVSKWLKELLCKDNVQRGEFLIILGNCNTKGVKERYFGYKGYLFNSEHFRFEPLL